ncbi:MAG: hypothetical protein GAK41_00155 [Burkholderia gladioli]|nr:MAG: hypothetical protein GAK41_00155 [Burkholderia gladioli]
MFVGLLSAALLASLARKTSARRVPCALRLEPGTGALAAYDRSGRRLAHGAVVRCTHWADRLLVLEIAREHGRPVPFVVPTAISGACVGHGRFRGTPVGVATIAFRVASLVNGFVR